VNEPPDEVGSVAPGDEGRFVRIDDTSLWVVERGDPDGFPLVVLHGGPGLDHHEFADYLDPLGDLCRLLLVDQRAQGRSLDAPRSTWGLDRHAQDVIMLARALRLGRHGVFGHSYGAFVALQHAVDYPGMAALTIVSGGVASMRWLEAVEGNLAAFEPEELREQVAASWAREQEVASGQDVASLMHDQWPFHFADPLDPRIADYEARSDGWVFSPEVLRHSSAQGYGGIEVEDRLVDIPGPVLILAGRHDRTCVVEASETMAAAIPHSELLIFDESAHMMFVEEQELFLAAVRSFVERHR
jgi:pimeloyl-ACP methyl ester carboxylesterase